MGERGRVNGEGATSRGCGDVRTSVDVDVPGPTTVPCVRAINRRASKISLAHTRRGPPRIVTLASSQRLLRRLLVLDRFSYGTYRRTPRGVGRAALHEPPSPVIHPPATPTPSPPETPRKPRPANATDSQHLRLRGNATPEDTAKVALVGDLEG